MDGFYKRYHPAAATPLKSKELPVSSSFYQRYIPPAKAPSPSQEPVSPPTQTINRATTADSGEARAAKRTQDGLPARIKATKDEPQQAVEDLDDAKHARVREKYARSMNRVGRKAENQQPDTDGGGVAQSPIKHGLEPLPQPTHIDQAPAVLAQPLPSWMHDPVRVRASTRADMKALGVREDTVQNLRKRGWHEAFAVQTAILPLAMPGNQKHDGDLCVSASTGSGKTLAYVLPMVEKLRDRHVRRLRGLVVVPTRELVNQVFETLETCASGSGLQIGKAVGNRTVAEEKAALMEKVRVHDPVEYHRKKNMTKKEMIEEVMRHWDDFGGDDGSDAGYEMVWKNASKVDILICTPGRLVDHIRTTKDFTLEDVETLVIDEADRLLDQSFQEWVETVIPALEYTPEPPPTLQTWRMMMHLRPARTVQKMILSATMTRDIGKLLSLRLKNPKLVSQEGQSEDEQHVDAPQAFKLPPTLEEIAVPLGKQDEAPLILVHILDGLLQHSADLDAMALDDASSNASESTSDTDTSANNSSAGDSSDTDSISNDEPVQLHSLAGQSNHGVLIFTKSNESAVRLSRLLALLRPQWDEQAIIGTVTKTTKSSAGRRVLAAFRKRRLSILVASDRLARGLDISNLASVVNYDVPQGLQNYVHQVGRTARAGCPGQAFTLVEYHKAKWFWNEIGRSSLVQRSGKVQRRDAVGKEISDEQKEAYGVALSKLGKEATGST